MPTTKEQKTYADYQRLPEGAPYELIGGELVMSPSPTYVHQYVIKQLSFALSIYVEERELGEVLFAPMDVYFSETETYQPDILFISNERRGIIEKERIHGAPDLIAEVLSPSTGYYDLTHKKEVYEAHGVQEYWIVDPGEQTSVVYQNRESGFQEVNRADEVEAAVPSRLLDGFKVRLQDLLPRES